MNSITHFIFIKNSGKSELDKIKKESSKIKDKVKSPRPLKRTKSRNKSTENFLKFQWPWII